MLVQLVTLEQAATDVGVHPMTIRYYLRRGYLTKHPMKPLDRRRYVDMDELRELMKNRPKSDE